MIKRVNLGMSNGHFVEFDGNTDKTFMYHDGDLILLTPQEFSLVNNYPANERIWELRKFRDSLDMSNDKEAVQDLQDVLCRFSQASKYLSEDTGKLYENILVQADQLLTKLTTESLSKFVTDATIDTIKVLFSTLESMLEAEGIDVHQVAHGKTEPMNLFCG